MEHIDPPRNPKGLALFGPDGAMYLAPCTTYPPNSAKRGGAGLTSRPCNDGRATWTGRNLNEAIDELRRGVACLTAWCSDGTFGGWVGCTWRCC